MPVEVLRVTYFSTVHSVLSYGTIFFRNSYIKSFFKIQKRMVSGRRVSCLELFIQLNILPLQSQYIFSLLLYIIKKRNQFLSDSEVQDITAGYIYNLHIPLGNLTSYQNGVFFLCRK
jgi:hypothetical protein